MNCRTKTGDCGVLVIIPCLNEDENIAQIIETVLTDKDRLALSIVVADGGSKDTTPKIVTAIVAATPEVRLMDNPLGIQSVGVNSAARRFGKGKRWLVRMDAHASYPDHFVSTLVAEAMRTGAPSVVVAMRSEGRRWFQKAVAAAQNSLIGTGGSAHRRGGSAGFVDHGHHALFELDLFLALHGYDETQSHNEDAEFDARLTRSGGRIWLTRLTSMTYYPRGRVGDLFWQYWNYGRGRATTILRHRGRPKLRQILPAAVLPSAALLALTPWSPLAALPFLVWIAACLLFGAVLGVRTRASHAFAASFAAIVMHLGWSAGFWRGMLSRASAPAGLICKQEYP